MKQKLWITLVAYLAYCIDKELYKAIAYLYEQVRVLVEQQEKQNKRILLTKYMKQVARILTDYGGFLKGKRYLIHDRDPLYNTKGFHDILNHLILSSVQQLEYVLEQYCQYYHHERIHQSLGRIIEPKHNVDDNAEIRCIEQLGGLLKSYHRLAA